MNSHAELDSLVGLDPSDEAFLLSPIGKDARGEQGTRHLYPSIGLYECRLGPRACRTWKDKVLSHTAFGEKMDPVAISKRTLFRFPFFFT